MFEEMEEYFENIKDWKEEKAFRDKVQRAREVRERWGWDADKLE